MTDRSRTNRFLRRQSRRSSNDRGVIAVLFALLVGVLILPVCAFCLDLANLRLSADQLQQQVRSAAVTGVFEYQSGASLTATQQSVANVLLANDITATSPQRADVKGMPRLLAVSSPKYSASKTRDQAEASIRHTSNTAPNSVQAA